MKDKVEGLAKGIFEYEQPELLLSEEALNISVCAGASFCGKILVYNRSLTEMKGVVYSSSEFLVPTEKQFIGKENEIHYVVHAEFARAGEQHKGELTVVSDCGEYCLPFTIDVTPMHCKCPEGEIRDLFQFTGLAQSNWSAAKEVFQMPSFETTVLADRVGEQTLYRQLLQSTSMDTALEEFLVYSKKKSPVQIRADHSALIFRPEGQTVKESILLRKDGWGFTDVSVETIGDFFMVSAKRITAEQFHEGRYVLEVAVDRETLSEGHYFGRILLKTARQNISIEVSCICEKTAREDEKKRHLFHVAELKLFGRYFDFRTGREKAANYITESESLVELLLVRNQESIFPKKEAYKKELLYRMYRAYLALIGGKTGRAETEIELLLAEQEHGQMDPELTGALYYLEAMRQKSAEGVRFYAEQIRSLCERYPEYSLLLWFHLYTDKRKENSRAAHLAQLRQHIEMGQNSPLLYFEVLLLWNEDPSLIREFGPMEQQVFWFAIRRKIMKKEVVLQCALAAEQARRTDRRMLRCFAEAYRQFGQREVLRVLCSMLIAGEIREEKYHRYFAEGCAAQIRLEGLQEYYIYTCGCSLTKQLDPSVLMYFIYGDELMEPYRAFFYAYVIRNKTALGPFYRTYLKRIEPYAVNGMKEGRIDSFRAIVYTEILRNYPLDATLAQALPGLLFSYRVECSNPEMTAVCVRHKEEETDTVVALEHGVAYIELYTEDAGILLCDAAGNRYLPSNDTQLQRMLHEEELLAHCYEQAGENRMLLLNLLEKVHNFRSVAADAIELSKRVAALSGLKERFRQGELHALVKYCYDNFQAEPLDYYLTKLDLTYLEKEERCQMVELLIVRGRYDLALDAVTRYGMDGISPKRLLKLCERMLLQCGEESNDMLLLLCREVFGQNQYNDKILRYLNLYYNGTTAEMFRIWETCEEAGLAAGELEERLLGQHLFAENYLPDNHRVFFSYCQKRVNPKLVRAYLSFYAYRYFAHARELSAELYPLLRREAEENSTICRLALLKVYSERASLTEEERQFADRSMEEFARQNMLFPFFTDFAGKASVPPEMEGKVYVEYHTRPEHTVRISYLYDNTEQLDFITEEMKHIGYGYFVREFILFYEEMLQYYITEENESGQSITESFFKKADEEHLNDETTKYGQINLILTAMDLQDEKTMMDMLENYYRMEYTVNHLFSPIKE